MSNPTTKEHEFFIDQIMQFTFEFTFLRNKFFWGVLLAEHVKKIEHPHDCVRVVRWLHCFEEFENEIPEIKKIVSLEYGWVNLCVS